MGVLRNSCLIYLFLLFFSTSIQSEENQNYSIIAKLEQQLGHSTVKLAKKIDACQKQRAQHGAVELNKVQIESLASTRNDILTALYYLNYRNMYQCEKSARNQLAYELGLLYLLKKQQKQDLSKIEKIQKNLLYPSTQQLELMAGYPKTPKKLRVYLEATIGTAPFDLIATIQKNGI